MDISNGIGVGVSLFVQGCHFHCKNCFNKETWDFNGGKEWTKTEENIFVELASKDYISRVSILGGEPLAEENVIDVYHIVKKIKLIYPNKKIWIYSGYTYDAIINSHNDLFDYNRKLVLKYADYLVDGTFVDDLKDYKLKFRGSSNQNIIDLNKTRNSGKIITLEGY